MVADEVDDREMWLGPSRAEATPELLKEHDRRLSGAKHQNGVDVGKVKALIEDVDSADDLEAAALQVAEALRSRVRRRWIAVHGRSFDSMPAKEVPHEVCMRSGAAEAERSTR